MKKSETTNNKTTNNKTANNKTANNKTANKGANKTANKGAKNQTPAPVKVETKAPAPAPMTVEQSETPKTEYKFMVTENHKRKFERKYNTYGECLQLKQGNTRIAELWVCIDEETQEVYYCDLWVISKLYNKLSAKSTEQPQRVRGQYIDLKVAYTDINKIKVVRSELVTLAKQFDFIHDKSVIA